MATKNKTDIVDALRSNLLAHAEGKISSDEFERRQAEIHALVLSTPATEVGAEVTKNSTVVPAGNPVAPRSVSKLLILLPIVGVIAVAGLYVWSAKPGSSPALTSERVETSDTGGKKVDAAQIEQQLTALVAEVAKNPMNGEAWATLARAYTQKGQHAQAEDAYAKAAAILPPDASLLADWADSYVVAHKRQWDDTSRGLIKRALAADPRHLKSLSLAATDAFDNADYSGAIAYWKRLKDAGGNDASVRKYADDNIAEATALISGKGVASNLPASNEQKTGSTATSGAIAGTVAIAKKLRSRTLPTDAVFIVAKTTEGQGPPLAAKRYTVADLPIAFRLDDDASMIPGQGLSKAIDVVVTARISRSGNPLAQSGDMESAPQRAKVGSSELKLEINTVR